MEVGTTQFTGCLHTTSVFYAVGMRLSKGEDTSRKLIFKEDGDIKDAEMVKNGKSKRSPKEESLRQSVATKFQERKCISTLSPHTERKTRKT